MIKTSIKTAVKGGDIRDKLGRFASKIHDMRAPNAQLATQLYAWVQRNFESEGGLTEDGAWVPLALSTIKQKARKGYSKILQNTGQLRASATPFHDERVAGVGMRRLSDLADGRPPDLARIHHEGTGNIPARQLIPTREQALELGVKVYGVYVRRMRERSGL